MLSGHCPLLLCSPQQSSDIRLPTLKNADILGITYQTWSHFTHSETEPSSNAYLPRSKQACHGNSPIWACLVLWLSWGRAGEKTYEPFHAISILFGPEKVGCQDTRRGTVACTYNPSTWRLKQEGQEYTQYIFMHICMHACRHAHCRIFSSISCDKGSIIP